MNPFADHFLYLTLRRVFGKSALGIGSLATRKRLSPA